MVEASTHISPALRDASRNRILKDMLRAVKKESQTQGYMVLVCDEVTLQVVSSNCKLYDLMQEGVSLVEQLERVRKDFPQMEAIYFITPTEASVDRMIKDFEDKKSPHYGGVHLCFTSSVNKPLMTRIGNSETLMAKVLSFKEVNIEFALHDDNVFSLEMPSALSELYSREGSPTEFDATDRVTSKLLTLCTTLYEYPYIQYNASSRLSTRIAKELDGKMFQFVNNVPDYSFNQEDRAILLILDRSIDPLTPLLHDFYYEAMTYDLLDIQHHIYKYESQNNLGQVQEKECLLTSEDELWRRYKYRHLMDVLESIPEEMNAFIESNRDHIQTNAPSSKQMDINQLSTMVRNMPEYQALLNKFTIHINLSEKVMSTYNTHEIEAIAEIEQDLATGINADGKEISATKIISAIARNLPNMSEENKLRLILAQLIAIETGQKDRVKLTQSLDANGQRALQNLIWLGINPQKQDGKKKSSTKRIDKKQVKANKERLKNVPTHLSRAVPPIQEIAKAAVNPQKQDGKKKSSTKRIDKKQVKANKERLKNVPTHLSRAVPPIQEIAKAAVNPQKQDGKKKSSTKRIDKKQVKANKERLKNVPTHLSRAVPPIQEIAKAAVEGHLEMDKYPFVKAPPEYQGKAADTSNTKSIRKGRKNLGDWGSSSEPKKNKVIICVLGGICYAELRAVNEIIQEKPGVELFIGGTAIIKPNDYTSGLKNMLTLSEYDEKKGNWGDLVVLKSESNINFTIFSVSPPEVKFPDTDSG
eukprot:CAMPEP_0115011938 /NCGR_PEP_ID=MMETSP0216-20121206/24390_1 /TAXON_ID=223996 /ORGANISM="Protocruzia adherens, Strain Boccale" /LENGTH=757 /DNA_ID=CAMNT_0002380801 /DNA_START=1464 /DNA_END=3738 /DNA_ORIENTATION=+